MKNKKHVIFIFVLVFLVFLNLSAKKKDKFEKWMDEVNPIITNAEKAEFKKLQKEKEKEFFIKLFWAKRDPTPQTEKNELQEEYYKRLSHVKKAYIYGYKKGAETDMGKAYLYFGKPKVFHQSKSSSSIDQTPPRDDSPSMHTEREHPPQMWLYPTLPWMNIPKEGFNLVFSHDGVGYVLDREKTETRAMQAFFSYPEKILFFPDLKEIPKRRKIITFSPESFEGKLIQELKSAQEDIVQIPFEKKTIFTKAKNNSSYLTILLKIDPADKKEIIEKKLKFFGRVESESYFYDFSEEKIPVKEKGYFISQVGLPLRPGEYKLYLGFYCPDKNTYSIRADNIEVPDFWTQELAFSSLLVSSQVQEMTAEAKKEEFDVFYLGRYSLLPIYSQEYTKEESLNIFYYVYNPALDENQNCSLTIELELQLGEKKFNLNPQQRQRKVGEEGAIMEGHQIPLSALPESGEYQLTVKVTDEIAKKTISKKLKFILL
ncbi:MAG: GWxTD domain-containing protein [Candidatus Aminicenantes bacterium]|nr:GWxTD domain-containing protein [Candidatus Aminicenantes bacterium]